jgi:hypothetical protein
MLMQEAVARARRYKLPFNREAVRAVLETAPDVCPVLGIEFAVGTNSEASPTLDRLDPTKGYVAGNMTVISMLANRVKSTASPEQIEAVAKWMRAR